MRRNRSSFTFPDFSLRRFLLQARAARGSPTLGNRCDIEKAASSTSKGEKSSSSTSSNKVSVFHKVITILLIIRTCDGKKSCAVILRAKDCNIYK